MNKKPFSQELHDISDPFGRSAVKKYIKKAHPDWVVEDNPDKYKIDLIVKKDDKVILLIEVEHRPMWTTEKFPFKTAHVPFRKKKFFDLSAPVIYCAVNKQGTRLLVIHKDKFKDAAPIEVPNVEVSSGEYFYDIRIEDNMYRNV
jgi:hypothetical protein